MEPERIGMGTRHISIEPRGNPRRCGEATFDTGNPDAAQRIGCRGAAPAGLTAVRGPESDVKRPALAPAGVADYPFDACGTSSP
jgi:hypothetical protein